uniref:RILP-like protein n=1 Tax=Acrobeloides nanus TaxID=290746 RepID=A0A914D989_9BILA
MSITIASPLPNSPPSSPSRQITVVDVYDLAASIGKDFELLIDQYGKESIHNLMPKVISALETLEAFANVNEKENAQIIDLQKTIECLEKEKQLRMQDKLRLEKDIVEVEESFKKEIDELWSMIRNLQGENKNLKNRLTTAKNEEITSNETAPVNDGEYQMIVDLKNVSIRQKDQKIKELQHDVEQSSSEVENLQNSIEKLIRQNKELLRKNGSLQKQGRILIQERNDLTKRVQQTEEDNFELRRILNDTSRACKDLEAQKNQLRDGDDVPRFTLAELREVLQEKNILKARVMELEEQLDFYRGKSTTSESQKDDELSRPSSSTSSTVDTSSNSTPASARSEEKSNEECVVYGPINREPEEKLYPWKYQRKESGVRRFFRNLVTFNSSGFASPRRDSTSNNASTS